MANELGDSLKSGSTVDRGDRSLLALLEIGAAAALIGSFFVPWYVTSGPGYTTWIYAGGYSPSALLTQDLLIPFASLVAVVVTLAGLAFPARGAKVAILVAFAAAFYGAILQFQEVLSGDSIYLVPPTAAWGLWLFAGTAAAGVVLAVVDLAARRFLDLPLASAQATVHEALRPVGGLCRDALDHVARGPVPDGPALVAVRLVGGAAGVAALGGPSQKGQMIWSEVRDSHSAGGQARF